MKKRLPGSFATCDDVPPFVWSSCAEFLAAHVHQLFSLILETCEWPEFWKCAFVTPIHEKESKNNVENYRPISNLPRLFLLFEQIIFNFLYSKLRYKLNSKHHGFRSGHSTITQLLVYLNELYANFDNNIEQVVVYLDFSKAFDCVNYNTLLTKLSSFGLDDRFLKLFKSYLFGRTQRARIDGHLSATVDITSGVPQGSVLGSLLFLLYIDDIIT